MRTVQKQYGVVFPLFVSGVGGVNGGRGGGGRTDFNWDK